MLEPRLDKIAEGAHPEFRLFLSAEPTDAMPIPVLQACVKLTNEPCEQWNCPTHINALDGKTPILKLTGDAGKAFDDPNALNIGNKWWYVCDKHLEVVQHWWQKLQCGGKVGGAIVSARPLMGKWESMGDAHSIIYQHSDGIRKLVVKLEHHRLRPSKASAA